MAYINLVLIAFTISSGSGTMPPKRPKCSTGSAPLMARRTSSTIWPALISATSTPFFPRAASAICLLGNGHRAVSYTHLNREKAITIVRTDNFVRHVHQYVEDGLTGRKSLQVNREKAITIVRTDNFVRHVHQCSEDGLTGCKSLHWVSPHQHIIKILL